MWLVDLVQLACLVRQEVVDLSMVAKPSVSGAANIEPEVQSFSLGPTQGRRADRWWSSLYHQHRRPRLDTWQADHGQHLVRDVEAGVVVIAAVVGADRSNRKIAISSGLCVWMPPTSVSASPPASTARHGTYQRCLRPARLRE